MFVYNFLFSIVTYLCMYCYRYIHRPKVYSKNQIFHELYPKYIFPLIYLPFGTLQSFFQLFRKVRIVKTQRSAKIVLKTEEGDEILMDVYDPILNMKDSSIQVIKNVKGDARKRKISNKSKISIKNNILLIHGLNGSSNSTYIKGMTNVFLKKGCRVFCFNARGAKSPPKSNYFSHIGLTSDIKHAVDHILEKYNGDLMVIGFSMGSNWTAKFYGEYSHPRIKAGVAVCCPFDYIFLSKFFKSSYYNCFINYLLSKNYKKYLKKSMINPPNFDKLKFVDQIDSKIIKFLNYQNLNEFYEHNSCKNHIKRIDKPFLFINSEDDPIIPITVIPIDKCIENPNIGIMTIKGGHLGFFINNSITSVEIITSIFYEKIFESYEPIQ